jgi:DnaK suppressor protein
MRRVQAGETNGTDRRQGQDEHDEHEDEPARHRHGASPAGVPGSARERPLSHHQRISGRSSRGLNLSSLRRDRTLRAFRPPPLGGDGRDGSVFSGAVISRGHARVAHVNDDRARELLIAERERIERELAELVHTDETTASETEEFDAGDRGRELTQDEQDEGRREELLDQLAAVGRAEQRLAEGTFGRSVQSGEPIPDERLELVPTAELTVAEAKEQARRLGR